MNIRDIRVSRSLLGAILVLFLLPFITVSCGGQQVTLTGAQLVTGVSYGGQNISSQFDVVLALLGVIAALGITWMQGTRSRLLSAIFVGISWLLLQFFKLRFDIMSRRADVPITVEYGFGFWLVNLALIAAVALNVLVWRELRRGGPGNMPSDVPPGSGMIGDEPTTLGGAVTLPPLEEYSEPPTQPTVPLVPSDSADNPVHSQPASPASTFPATDTTQRPPQDVAPSAPTTPSVADTTQRVSAQHPLLLIGLGVVAGGLLVGLIVTRVASGRTSSIASAEPTAQRRPTDNAKQHALSTTIAVLHEPATSRPVLAVQLIATQLPSPTQAVTLAPPTRARTVAVYAAPAPIPANSIQITASGAAPSGVNSCNQQTTYEPGNTIDGNPETAWRVPGDGRGSFVQLAFAAPMRVTELQLIPGYAKIDPCDGTNRFFQNRRVRQVELTFSDGSHVSGELRDDPSLQSITFAPVVTQSVRVTIVDTVAPNGSSGRDFTPMSEIVVMGAAV